MAVDYHIVDTETVGLRKPADASGVVSVAYLKIDPATLEVLEEFYSLVDPECDIEPGASAIHGIFYEDIADKPFLGEVFKVEAPTIAIGHNHPFDAKFLDGHYENKVGSYCTLAGARALYRNAPNHKLQTLADHLGLKRGEAHNALGDCHTTLGLLRRIVADSGRSLEQLVKAAAKPKLIHVMPFGAHKGTALTALPMRYIRWFDDREVDPDLRYSFDQQIKLRG
jgi:DNA polymerase III epsilon subunit-like protein